ATAAKLAMATEELSATRSSLSQQQQELAQVRSDNARLETRLQEERKASEEKLALLSRATEELRNAFQSLAADALKRNNESFLQLAEQKFEGLRQGAAGDFEQRKMAVQ